MKKKRAFRGILFILPSFVGVLIFYGIPYISVIIRSFQKSVTRDFCGIDNYIQIFGNQAFKLASWNTIKFELVCIPVLLVLSLIVSLGVMKCISNKPRIKSIFLVPMAIPAVSIVVSWQFLFDEYGLINKVLSFFNINGPDYMDTGWSFWILVLTYLWKNLGYDVILWTAGLESVPIQLYEAAALDGATKWQMFKYITLPNLKGVAFTTTILSILNSFKLYREAYLVAGNYPNENMYMLQHTFNNWYRSLSMDKMAAGSVVMGVVIAILVFLLRKSWEDYDENKAKKRKFIFSKQKSVD